MSVIPFERSFASHEKAKYWHETKNGAITPRDVSKGSGQKYWFKCNNCPHDFYKAPDGITRKTRKGEWCPYCTGQKLCKDKNCQHCIDKSFKSHEKAPYWHKTKKRRYNTKRRF